MTWPQDAENPMVFGDYFKLLPPLEDTEENRLDYVDAKGLGWKAAAVGLRVEPLSQDAIRDHLAEAWNLFLKSCPETAQEWADELLELDPYRDCYRDWLYATRMEISTPKG